VFSRGFGESKKIAKRQAAKAAWQRLESTPGELKQRCLNPKGKGHMLEHNGSNSPEKGPAMMKKETLKEQPKVIELGKNTLGVSESNTKNPKEENLGSPFTTLPISAQQMKQSKVNPSSITIQRHLENRREAVSYVGMLQDYCLKNNLQAPKYDHHPVKGDKKTLSMTCSLQDHRVTVYRESLKRCRTAAAKEMLVKLNVISPPKRLRKIDDTKNKRAKSVGKPKSEGTHVETSTNQGSKTKPEVVKPSVTSNRKILSGCSTESEDLEVKKLLDLACVKEGYCCHQEYKKIGLHSWVTTNRIQSGPSITFHVSRTRSTLESSIAATNRLTLEAFKVFVMDNSD